MPTLLRLNGFRFYFYSHEPNEPPHVHIDRGEATIKIWLDSLEVAKSRSFRARDFWHYPADSPTSRDAVGEVA